MTGKQHIKYNIHSIFFVTLGILISNHVQYMTNTEIIHILVGTYIGCLLPDVDHHKTKIGKLIPIHKIHKLFKWTYNKTKYDWKWKYPINIMIFKHGGVTHTYLINAWIFIISYYMHSIIGYGIAFGYYTHLHADDITGMELKMKWWFFDSIYSKIKRNKKQHKQYKIKRRG